jgi:hypothetical protein
MNTIMTLASGLPAPFNIVQVGIAGQSSNQYRPLGPLGSSDYQYEYDRINYLRIASSMGGDAVRSTTQSAETRITRQLSYIHKASTRQRGIYYFGTLPAEGIEQLSLG